MKIVKKALKRFIDYTEGEPAIIVGFLAVLAMSFIAVCMVIRAIIVFGWPMVGTCVAVGAPVLFVMHGKPLVQKVQDWCEEG